MISILHSTQRTLHIVLVWLWYCYKDVYINRNRHCSDRGNQNANQKKNSYSWKGDQIPNHQPQQTCNVLLCFLVHLSLVDGMWTWWPGLVWCKIPRYPHWTESDRTSVLFVYILYNTNKIKPTADYNIKLSRIQFSLIIIIITFMSRSSHCYHHPHSSSSALWGIDW